MIPETDVCTHVEYKFMSTYKTYLLLTAQEVRAIEVALFSTVEETIEKLCEERYRNQ